MTNPRGTSGYGDLRRTVGVPSAFPATPGELYNTAKATS